MPSTSQVSRVRAANVNGRSKAATLDRSPEECIRSYLNFLADPSASLDAKEITRLEKLVASYPNVVMWLVGHSHVNRVKAVKGESADAPGYFEVMTDAIADWPSQARAIELVALPDGTLSIFLSMIELEARTCLEARYRTWSLIDVTSGWSPDGSGALGDRNVELRRVVPAGVDLAGLGSDKIETETTLVGR